MANPWRHIDWNWRNFGRNEKVALALTAAGLVAAVIGGIWSYWSRNSWNFGAFMTFLISPQVAIHTFNFFVLENGRRRGIVAQPYEPHPGRPISVGAMQAILGGGFVLLAALLGLFIWLAR